MAIADYKCEKCKKMYEYNSSFSVPKSLQPPKDMKCPDCTGDLEKQFSGKISFDVIGGYEYQYGKKNWKKNLSKDDTTKVLNDNKPPY